MAKNGIVPEEFPAVGGWTYERVWNENQEFSQYVLKITNCTGFMKDLQEYCQMKDKENNVGGVRARDDPPRNHSI